MRVGLAVIGLGFARGGSPVILAVARKGVEEQLHLEVTLPAAAVLPDGVHAALGQADGVALHQARVHPEVEAVAPAIEDLHFGFVQHAHAVQVHQPHAVLDGSDARAHLQRDGYGG